MVLMGMLIRSSNFGRCRVSGQRHAVQRFDCRWRNQGGWGPIKAPQISKYPSPRFPHEILINQHWLGHIIHV